MNQNWFQVAGSVVCAQRRKTVSITTRLLPTMLIEYYSMLLKGLDYTPMKFKYWNGVLLLPSEVQTDCRSNTIVEATKIRATMNISTTNLWSDSFLEKQARIQIGSIYLCGTKGFSIQWNGCKLCFVAACRATNGMNATILCRTNPVTKCSVDYYVVDFRIETDIK